MNKVIDQKNTYTILLFIIALGAFLRIYNLGKQSIWFDEARAYSRANKSVYSLWVNQKNESNPPLYDIIFHFYLKFITQKEEFQIRFLAALFGVASIPIIFIAGRHLFNSNTGLVSSLLLSLSPYHIYYSQDAKMYSLLFLLSLCSFIILYLCLERDKKKYWITYGLVSIFIIYCHNYGIFIFFSQFLIFLLLYLRKNRGLNYKKYFLCSLIVLFLSLYRIRVLFYQYLLDFNPWIPPLQLKDIIQTFCNFILLSPNIEVNALIKQSFLLVIPIYTFIFLFALFFKNNGERIAKIHFASSVNLIYTLGHILFPLLLVFLISLKKPIYVAGRYDIVFFAPFLLIVSFGLNKVTHLIHRYSLLSGIILSLAFSLHSYYFEYYKSNDRKVEEYIHENSKKNDILVFTNLTSSSFFYYVKEPYSNIVFDFPERRFGILPKEAYESDRVFIDNEIAALKNKIKLNKKNDSRILLMFSDLEINKRLIIEFKKNYLFLNKIDFDIGRSSNQVSSILVFTLH